MGADDLVDVALVARLRPPALRVLVRRLLELVLDLLEPSAAQPVELAALAADDGDERALAAAEQPEQRREVQRFREPNVVGDGTRQRQRQPQVVELRAEDRVRAHAAAVEVEREVLLDPLDVGVERLLLLARERVGLEAGGAAAHVEQRVDARLDVARVDRVLRVEVEIEADRTALCGAEARKLAEYVESHRRRHGPINALRPRFHSSASTGGTIEPSESFTTVQGRDEGVT